MAKGTPKSAAAIQRLLDERGQVLRWIQRLDMAGDAAPEQVRSRVRRGYSNRLNEGLRGLGGHSQGLHAALLRLRTIDDGLRKQEAEAAERMAEAELRHAVGEYEETQWRQVHAGLLGELVKLREELKQSGEEIARVEEVVLLITTEPEPEPEPQ